MTKIPTWIERFVGPGEMSDKTIICDWPMLSMVLVNLQNDQARGAVDYNELRVMPKYMEHLVGNVEICTSEKTCIVDGKERMARSGAIWVLFPMISDQEKITIKKGVKYVKPQISKYMERYFGTGPVVANPKTDKKGAPKHKTRMRFIDEDEEYLKV